MPKTKNDLIKHPDERLKQRSQQVKIITDEVRQLAEEMAAAMYDWEDSRDHETAAALAAIQIGQAWRVVIVRDDFENKKNRNYTVLLNPKITKTLGEPQEDMEGCLSVNNVYGKVPRYPKVKVKAMSLDGKEVRFTAEGFLARVIQHEIDHTNGMLFLDRVESNDKLFKLEEDGKYTKYQV